MASAKEFVAALEEARSYPNAGDVIESVKKIVYDELSSLDPTATITSTQYYNHSLAPDFVLTWKDQRQKADRDVFLRPDIAAGTSADELKVLTEVTNKNQAAPVVLALRPTLDKTIIDAASFASNESPQVLVTDAQTVGELTASETQTKNSPLRDIVQSSLLRGGRGILLESDVPVLMGSAALSDTSSSEFDTFLSQVKKNFTEDAALRIERTAQLINMALTGDLGLLDSAPGEPTKALGGNLTSAEIQLLLPFLLSNSDVTRDAKFWRHLGSMISLGALEAMNKQLSGMDLTPLVVPNINTWRAARASTALFLPPEADVTEGTARVASSRKEALDDSESVPPEAPPTAVTREIVASGPQAITATVVPQTRVAAPAPADLSGTWHFHANMISAVFGDLRVHISASSHRLNGHDATPARWSDIEARLSEFRLLGVDLQGLGQRRIFLESSTVSSDVNAISSTVEDTYHVNNVLLRSEIDADVQIEVSFLNSIVIATPPQASAAELGRMALTLLGYRRMGPAVELDALIPPPSS